jgi:nucleotide-binding universal stress UspA family protein
VTVKIVFATDFSESAGEARHEAIRLARVLAAEIVVVHVLPDKPFYSDGHVDLAAQQHYSAHWAAAEKRLRAEIVRIQEVGVPARGVMLGGKPAQQIVRVASDERADFIVIGTHGAGFVERLLVGSVAERVIRTAACPVLIVRGAPAVDRGSRPVRRGPGSRATEESGVAEVAGG